MPNGTSAPTPALAPALAGTPPLLLAPDIDRLDTTTAPGFLRDTLVRLAGPAGVRNVVIDLGGVDFIDSTGLGALVAVRRALPEGGRLRLVSANPRLHMLLEMTRLAAVLPTFASTREALAS